MEKYLYLKLDKQRKILQEDIKEITQKRLIEIYQQNIPKNIQERYEFELNIILKNKYENIYILLYLISNKVKEDNEIVLLSGTIGSSFIVYLLGITDIDPIKYNIPFEVSCGIDGHKKPDFELVFSKRYLTKIKNYIECILKEKNLLTDETSNETSLKLNLRRNEYIDMILELEKVTGVNPKTISFDDKETMKLIENADTLGVSEFNSSYVRKLIFKTKPTTFEDLIIVNEISRGTDVWYDNQEDLIKNGTITLKEVIACRDDIMNNLIGQGIEKEIAFYITESVRKGKVRKNKEEKWKEYKEIMKNHNVPDWYIKTCEKISFLFPRAHAINYVMNSFRIAYYKVHYPKEFYKSYFNTKASKNIDVTILNNKEELIKVINELKEKLIINEDKLLLDTEFLLNDFEVALEMNEKGIKI